MFLAGFLRWTDDAWPIIIGQSLIAGLSLGLLATIGYFYSSKLWSIAIITILYAFIGEIALEYLVQRETGLFSLLLIVGAAIFIIEELQHRWWNVVALGLVLGLMALVRPVALGMLFFMGMWGLRLRILKLSWVEVGKRLLVFAIVFTIVLLPWGVRNKLAIGKFTVSSTTAGLNLWKGNNPSTKDFYPRLDVDVLQDLVESPPQTTGWGKELRPIPDMTEVEQDLYLRRLAQSYITAHPLEFFSMGLRKLYALWTPQFVPLGYGEIELTSTGVRILDYQPYNAPIAAHLILYLFTLIGLWHLRKTPLVWFFMAWVIFLSAVHFVTFGESRFRWPLNMLSLPIAAAGVQVFLSRLTKTWRLVKSSTRR
jgi:hypothetical protein